MVIVWALSWWYGAGWKSLFISMRERLAVTYDYFSINLLASSLFSPFRQISAGIVNGPLDVKVRAFFDLLISRCIGAIVRSILIIVGVVWLLLQSIVSIIIIAGWAVVPFMPFVGFVAMVSGRTLL